MKVPSVKKLDKRMSGYGRYSHSVTVDNSKFDGAAGRLDVMRTRISFYLELTQFLNARFGPGIPLEYSYIYSTTHNDTVPDWAWRRGPVEGVSDTIYLRGEEQVAAYEEFLVGYLLQNA